MTNRNNEPDGFQSIAARKRAPREYPGVTRVLADALEVEDEPRVREKIRRAMQHAVIAAEGDSA